MTAQYGVSTLTSQRIVMGPGKVYTGTSKANGCLGATMGGNILEINRVFRDIRPDGALGKVKGFRYLENAEYSLTVKLMELTEDIIYYALAGSSLAAHVISGGDIGQQTQGNVYIGEVQLDLEIKGTTATTEANLVSIVLKNVLVEGPFTINAPEGGPATVELKFTAHYDASALTTEPFSITFTPVA